MRLRMMAALAACSVSTALFSASPAYAGTRSDTTVSEYCFAFSSSTDQWTLVAVTATVDTHATSGFLTEEAIGFGANNPFGWVCNLTGTPPSV